jgi:hypothetical protein
VELRDYYAQLVREHEQKLAIAREKLAIVEVLLAEWSEVNDPPFTKEPPRNNKLDSTSASGAPLEVGGDWEVGEGEENEEGGGESTKGLRPDELSSSFPLPSSPTPPFAKDAIAGVEVVIADQVSTKVLDVAVEESTLTEGNGHVLGVINDCVNGRVNDACYTPSPQPSFLLTQFIDSLDTSTRSLISFCEESGAIELERSPSGGNRLFLVCPNTAVFRRFKLKLPGLAAKLNGFVGSRVAVFVSELSNPIDPHKCSFWESGSPQALGMIVDKEFERDGTFYTQLTHVAHNWLVVVSDSVLSKSALISNETQLPQPHNASPIQAAARAVIARNNERTHRLRQNSLSGVETPLNLSEVAAVEPDATHGALVNDLGHADQGGSEVELLSQYQGMNRIEALSKVLTAHIGTVLHLDFIVWELYGELEPLQFKVIKSRVGSSLTQGVEQNRWARVPDSPGCYTLDLSLVEEASSKSSKQPGASSSSKRNSAPPSRQLSAPMLPPYQGHSLFWAVTTFLQENQGKVLSVDDVIKGLFGEVEPRRIGQVRQVVSNRLSKGKVEGRFTSVPGPKGHYTWDLSLVEMV